MPAELLHHGRKRLGRVERHAAAIMQRAVAKEMIEAQAAHARRMPAPKLSRRDLGIRYRNAAKLVRMARQRIEHGGVVAPMRACLHQHAPVETERIEHAEIFRE